MMMILYYLYVLLILFLSFNLTYMLHHSPCRKFCILHYC